MSDINDFEDRNLAENEEVIAKAINYLKYKNPRNANREYAVELLKRMQRYSKTLADSSSLTIEEYIDKYDQMFNK